MIDWPANLPAPQFGLQYNVTDPQMRTRFLSGRSISRRRFSDVPTEFQARWVLTTAEAIEFDRFYLDDMIDGTEWAKMPLVTAEGQTLNFVRFRGGYSSRKIGPGLWEYTANMQMYLRPGSPEWPTGLGGDPGPGPTGPYLTFAGESDFTLKNVNSQVSWDGILEYSTDKELWVVWDGAEIVSSGRVLYLRGKGNTVITGAYSRMFVISGASSVSCDGNIMSLLDWEAPGSAVMGAFCFAGLFQNCASLVKAPNLPSTGMKDSCYASMFKGCSGLLVAPNLPATFLAASCYTGMFSGCSGLLVAPSLPANSLEINCYRDMFSGCTSLSAAPALPATDLAGNCYYQMFVDCSSIIHPPELPATIMFSQCYLSMFRGCTSLAYPPDIPATILAQACCFQMFSGCSSIMISQTPGGVYNTEWRVPSGGEIAVDRPGWSNSMFQLTGGSYRNFIEINRTYYIKKP